MPQVIYAIPLFLCRNVTTTTRWSEICNLTHLWRNSFFWNVRCIKPVMLLKMSSFTSIFQAFWPQIHLNLARRDFWSPSLFKTFYMTFEKLTVFAQKSGINHITFFWQWPITMKVISLVVDWQPYDLFSTLTLRDKTSCFYQVYLK